MKRHLKRFQFFLKDPDKKPFYKIIKEFIQLWILKKELPVQYFGRFFYRNNAPDGKDFMDLRQYLFLLNKIEEYGKTSAFRETIQNKLLYSKFCKKHNLPSAKLVSYNLQNKFHYNDEVIEVNSSKDMLAFFKRTLEEKNLDALFLKIFDGNGGYGAILLKKETLQTNYEEIWDNLKDNRYIHQEVIEQLSIINQIYSKSINSLRIETHMDAQNKKHFLGFYMRFGSGNSHVDNISQGGIYVPVDMKTGTFFPEAATNLIHGGKVFDKHPDTGFVFKDFKVPYFEEALALVEKMLDHLPGYMQSWDIVFTPEGPICLEGNNSPSLLTGEYSYRGYKNHPVMRGLLKECE